MRLHLMKLLCIAGLVFEYELSFAQSCCSAGVPISGSLGLTEHKPRLLQFMLTYDYNRMTDLRDGLERLENDPRTRAAHTAILESAYSFTKRFSTSILIPYIVQTRNVSVFPENPDFQAAQGFGDMVLLPKVALLPGKKKLKDSKLLLGAGVKFPTGSNSRTNDAGLLLAADMQPGTGSWDGIFWMYYSQQHLFKPNLHFSLNATYNLTGVNDEFGLGSFSRSFQFGREFQTTTGFAYNAFAGKVTLIPSLLFKYRTITANRENSFEVPNTGGHWLFIIPSLGMEFTQSFSVRVFSETPIYRKLEGTQITTTFRAGVSFLYKISFEKKQEQIKYFYNPQNEAP